MAKRGLTDMLFRVDFLDILGKNVNISPKNITYVLKYYPTHKKHQLLRLLDT
jgi:hypothetical protein